MTPRSTLSKSASFMRLSKLRSKAKIIPLNEVSSSTLSTCAFALTLDSTIPTQGPVQVLELFMHIAENVQRVRKLYIGYFF